MSWMALETSCFVRLWRQGQIGVDCERVRGETMERASIDDFGGTDGEEEGRRERSVAVRM